MSEQAVTELEEARWAPLGERASGLPSDVVAVVREACEREPQKPALIFEDGVVVSREEFRRAVEVFAGYLAGHVDPGDRIVMMLENRTEFMIGWIAANACGAGVVSVNTDHGHLESTLQAVEGEAYHAREIQVLDAQREIL